MILIFGCRLGEQLDEPLATVRWVEMDGGKLMDWRVFGVRFAKCTFALRFPTRGEELLGDGPAFLHSRHVWREDAINVLGAYAEAVVVA